MTPPKIENAPTTELDPEMVAEMRLACEIPDCACSATWIGYCWCSGAHSGDVSRRLICDVHHDVLTGRVADYPHCPTCGGRNTVRVVWERL